MRPAPRFRRPPVHVHTTVACPGLGHALHANLYRFGAVEGARPLLVYIGGSIDSDTYVGRAGSEPAEVLDQLRVATGEEGLAAHDFLVCPAPPRAWGTGVLGQDFLGHFQRDLLPKLDGSPSTIGLVGYSMGAYLAACIAFREPLVSALAFVGAANPGAAGAPLSADEEKLDWSVVAGRLRCESYRNEGDPSDPKLSGLEDLPTNLAIRKRALGSADDGHGFEYYAKNNAFASAFRFALKRMNRVHLGMGD